MLKSVYVKTVEELITYLQTLPKDLVVCDDESDSEGVYVDAMPEYNMVMIKGVWDVL